MPDVAHLITFALIALGLVMTPGPNMIYLISRSVCQGARAGMISLAGIGVGFLIYMLLAAFGITALVMAVPYAYDALRIGGAAYLLYLAGQAIRPGGRSPLAIKDLPADSPKRLFAMGLVTNLLNPKIAVMYLSLLPQFIEPGRGGVLGQSLALGTTQISVAMIGDGLIVLGAGAIARFLGERPGWATVQRWFMATVLGGLAVRMATERAR